MKLLVGLLNIVVILIKITIFQKKLEIDYNEIDKHKCDNFTGLSNDKKINLQFCENNC